MEKKQPHAPTHKKPQWTKHEGDLTFTAAGFAVGEHHEQKPFGEERAYFILQVTVYHRRKPGQELQPELEAEAMEDHRLPGCQPPFFYSPGLSS